MDANTVIKIDDLQQQAAELTLEQLQAVVGGWVVCRTFATAGDPLFYGTEDEFSQSSHWDVNITEDEDCYDNTPGSGSLA